MVILSKSSIQKYYNNHGDFYMFVYELKLATTNFHHEQLQRRFKMAENIYRTTQYEILNRVKKQKKDPRNKTLKKLWKQIKSLKNQVEEYTNNKKKAPKELTDEIKRLEKERNAIFKQLDIDYDLRGNFSFGKFANNYRNARNYAPYIGSDVAAKLGFRAWDAYEKVKFNKGAQKTNLHNPLMSFEAKGDTCITIRNGILKMGTKHAKFEVPVIYKNDDFEREVFTNTFKYNRIVRRFENNKWQYYVQMIFDGTPPQKDNYLKGTVGIDVGLTYIAISTPYEVEIIELAPNIKNYDAEIHRLSRKLDRQRRANNPNNYNEDGTIKKGRKTWIKSKAYIKTKNKIADLRRKQAAARKLAHKELANKIVAKGDKFIVRQVDFENLMKRSSETKVSEKTGKFLSKKRAGKTIGSKAPAMFLEQLAYKAAFENKPVIKIDPSNFNSRKFDHHQNAELDVEKLSKSRIIDGHNVQTNLYSAYLLSHIETSDNPKIKPQLNIKDATNEFDNFLRNQDFYLSQNQPF